MGARCPLDGLVVLPPLSPLLPPLVHLGQVLHRLVPDPGDDGVVAVVIEVHFPKTIVVFVVGVQPPRGLLVYRWFRRFFCLPALTQNLWIK